MVKCLITGGAGFIGSHLVHYLLEHTDWDIYVVDNLTYAAQDGRRLRDLGPRFSFTSQDVCVISPLNGWNPDYIVHLAAETHVDTSIANPSQFIHSNVYGTFKMLQYARGQSNLKKFLYFSTDEVFGAAPGEEFFHEDSRYNSGNPYAATKAAGEELALAWGNTYGVPVVVTHCCNVIGYQQHEEKFIPKLVRKILQGETVNIHADGRVGSRMYVHAHDVALAVYLILGYGQKQQKYNIPGVEIFNLDMAKKVADALDMTLCYKLVSPQTERPGWDPAYRISGEKLKKLGWEPTPNFDAQIRDVVLREMLEHANQAQSKK